MYNPPRIPRIFRLPFFPVIIAPFILLSPVLFTGKALFWGTPSTQFVPWWTWAWDTLLSGHLPLWNPLLGMGAPLVANYQSALFYPPNWLYFLFYAVGGISALAWSQALVVALHLVWSGLGMALLARRLGLGKLAQTVSGLAFGLSGYLVARAWFASINAAVAWLPWILLLTFDVATSRRDRAQVAKLGLLIGVQLLAGHAQTSWYNLLLAAMWAGFWAWQGGDNNAHSQHSGMTPNTLPNTTPDVAPNTAPNTAPLKYLRQNRARKILSTKSYTKSVQISANRGLKAHVGTPPQLVNKPCQNRVRKIISTNSYKKSVRIRAIRGFIVAVLLGVTLAAVQLLPTAEYLLQSQRASAVDYEAAMTYSFWPWRFLSMLAPDLFGNPVNGDYWGYGNFWEDAIYIGLLPLLLAAGAILTSIRKPSKTTADRRQQTVGGGEWSAVSGRRSAVIFFLLAITTLAFLLALGQNTPIFPWLYRHIPTFDMFQAPTRISIWAVFALSLLAGIGADRWRRPVKRGLYWTRLATAGTFAVSLGAGLAWYMLGDVRPTFIRATALAGLWGLGVGVLALTAPETNGSTPRSTLRWQWGAALWIAADLLVAGWGLNPGIDLDFYRQPPPTVAQVREMAADGRLYLLADDEDQIRYKRFFLFDTFDSGDDWRDLRAVLLPNINMLDKIPVANNYDPLIPGRYARWMDAVDKADANQREDLWDLMGISVLGRINPAWNCGVGFVPRESAARLRWVPCAHPVDGQEAAWEQVFSGQTNFGTEVIIENADPPNNPDCGASRRPPEIVAEHPNKIILRVAADSPGWMVLSDVWYPGWRAWVDGEPVSVLRANYLFRAVEVPAGPHEVVFAYRPVWFYAGLAVSLLAWLGLAWYVKREA
ncbi:MAG: YfhO family protein [Chloroflexi bacterium]|nr:YfhO family protein [Chloroflexota bacterium]